MRQIIIISFTFPPQGGIGGRRWAKFSKYFKREGLNVKVYTAPFRNNSSPWKEDTIGVEVVEIETGFPRVIRFGVSTILDKIKYRLALYQLRKQVNGNFYDHSSMWHANLIPALKKEDLNSSVIIASAGPFSYLADLIPLKKEFPELKLIADFRDPWTTNKTAFGYSDLPDTRLKVEQEKEKQVVDDFDAIVSVASPMTDYFKSISNGQGIDKFHTILNGYDPEDYKFLPRSPKKSTSTLKIAFVGTLYNKTKQGLKALCVALRETDLVVEVTFCGDMTDEARELLSQLNQVKLLGKVSGTEARSIINESDVAMLLLTDDLTYSFSTKFCEYISMKKPIWIISKEGETPAFIVDHEIGVHSNPNKKDVLDGLQTLVQSISKLNYESFDARPFQIQKLSDDYVRIIRNLESKGE